MDNELRYQIALTLVPGIGPVKAKNLLAYCGSARAIFEEKQATLSKIPEIGARALRFLYDKEIMEHADGEVEFIMTNQIVPLFFC